MTPLCDSAGNLYLLANFFMLCKNVSVDACICHCFKKIIKSQGDIYLQHLVKKSNFQSCVTGGHIKEITVLNVINTHSNTR